MNLLILPPDAIHSRGSSVSGTVDATYDADWLCDGISSRPIRGTGTTHAYTCTFPATGDVNFVALINANTVNVNGAVSGGVTATLTANPVRANGLRRNPYAYITPVVGVSAVTLTITSNAVVPTIGEFVAGEAYEFERHIRPGSDTGFYAKNIPRDDDYDYLPSKDKNAYGRIRQIEIIATQSGANILEDLWDAQRGESAGFVMVPTPGDNDAWWGRMTAFGIRKQGPDVFPIRFTFREYASNRWG